MAGISIADRRAMPAGDAFGAGLRSEWVSRREFGRRSADRLYRRGETVMALAGRSAIVTGANQGLGEAIAERLAAEGASLLLCARGEAALVEVAERLARKAASGQ